MLKLHFDPDHPLLIGFSMLDRTTALLGGVDTVTGFICRELEALLSERRLIHSPPILIGGAYVFNIRFPLIGAPHPNPGITLALRPVTGAANRLQWLVRVLSAPMLQDLAVEDRITLSDLQGDIMALLVKNPAVEDVDVTHVEIEE